MLVLWSVVLAGAYAGPPPGYYAAAEGKSGTALRQALHAIVRNHHVIPYASSAFDTSDALKVLDQDPASPANVVGIYSRKSEPAASFGASSGWNREHLWCDSYGIDGREPAYSDLHNLRAEDMTVNSARANKFFDASDSNNAGFRFPADPEAPQASADDDSWEPPAEVKGDIARALFYMTVRYTGDVSAEPALSLTDNTNQISNTGSFMGRFGTLLRWSQADPVDAAERLRNDRAYAYQTNRNPFVDHPEWVAAAFLPVVSASAGRGSVTLTWTNDGPRMTAEQRLDLSLWTEVPNAPSPTSTNTWAITLPLGPGTHLFRLRLR